METELWIEGVGFPLFSARGCVQELIPVPGNDNLFQRTVNGDLIYLGDDSDVKYRTTIKCQDKEVPAFAHLWRGSLVKVGCMQPLIQPLSNGKATLSKPFIDGSVKVCNRTHKSVPFNLLGQDIRSEDCDDGYVIYRPILSMCLMDFLLSHNEWGAKAGWNLTLEEV
ncbi:MAG: hypothetical protein K2X98_05820 [Alphaproteobacteria bacterium]|nr:hypothetical protein [Alphaproteobacteria bacterium]